MTEKDKDGNTTSSVETVTQPDGSFTKTETKADGTQVVTKTDSQGQVTEKITYNPNGSYVKEGYDPQLIEGNQSVYRRWSMTFRSDDVIENFLYLTVDNTLVDPGYYDVVSGSIKVTLSNSYLRKLDPGVHTLAIVSTNGAAQGYFTIPTPAAFLNPLTGDSSNIGLWLGVMGVSALALVGAAVIIIKKQKKK